MKKNSGLMNRYSLAILFLMVLLVGFGIVLTYAGSKWYGLFLIFVGLSFCLGFEELKASPLEIGIITVLGTKRPVLVKGLTLLCDWLPISIVGVVKVPAVVVDTDFEEPFTTRCIDGATIKVKVSINYKPDTCDDAYGVSDPKTAGEKLIIYDEIGQKDGADDLLREMAENIVGEVAKRKGYVWMLSNKAAIDTYLKMYLEGQTLPIIEVERELVTKNTIIPDDKLLLTAVGNIRSMGIKIVSIQTQPTADDEIVKADNDRVLEKIQKDTDVEDINTHITTINNLIAADIKNRDELIRRKNAGENVTIPPPLTFKDAEQIVDRQKALKKGVRTVIDSTGNIVTLNTAGGGGKK